MASLSQIIAQVIRVLEDAKRMFPHGELSSSRKDCDLNQSSTKHCLYSEHCNFRRLTAPWV
jgi:hypothetical protein